MKQLIGSIIMMTVLLTGVTSAQEAGNGKEAAPSRAQQLMGATAPKLADLTDEVLYGDIWERPELSKRTAA